jgi:hypothetical protein
MGDSDEEGEASEAALHEVCAIDGTGGLMAIKIAIIDLSQTKGLLNRVGTS